MCYLSAATECASPRDPANRSPDNANCPHRRELLLPMGQRRAGKGASLWFFAASFASRNNKKNKIKINII